jgi:hypothetical protein
MGKNYVNAHKYKNHLFLLVHIRMDGNKITCPK